MSELQGRFEQVISIDTLVQAHRKAMLGKRSNSLATSWNYHFMSELLILQKELETGHYRPSAYRHRIINEPKRRKIQAPHFRDRIVHHAVHSVLNPLYERHFIKDSYACRQNKGVHKAAAAVQHILRGAAAPLYVCRLDVSKFYASINHARLKTLLGAQIKDTRLLELLASIIDSTDSGTGHDALFPPNSPYHTNGRHGIPIGNLTSQLFANIYMHHADQYAKQTLKIRRYIRYMDDIIFFHEDKQQLQQWQDEMIAFLEMKLHLIINPHKVRLYPTRVGVDFVGYTIYPTSKKLRGSSVRRFKRRYRRQLQGYVHGTVGRNTIEESLVAYEAHAAHANTAGLQHHLRSWLDEATFVRMVQRAYRRQTSKKVQQASLFDEKA